MQLFQRILSLLQKPVTFTIDFAEGRFVGKLQTDDRTLGPDALSPGHPFHPYVDPNAAPDKKGWFPVDMDAVYRLTKDNHESLLYTTRNTVVFAQNARAIRFAEAVRGLRIDFCYDAAAGVLRRILPPGVTHLEGRFFFDGQTIFRLPPGTVWDIAMRDTAAGQELYAIVHARDNAIGCDLQPAEDTADTLSALRISDHQIALHITGHLPADAVSHPKGLGDMAVCHHRLYRCFPQAARQAIFGEGEQATLVDAEIPEFVNARQDIIAGFGDEATRLLLSPGEMMLDSQALSFVLRAELSTRRGVGKVQATPTLVYAGRPIPARQVSEQLKCGYAPLLNRWISEKALGTLGIGPMGRLVDGTPLAQTVLKPQEILSRGGLRLEGPWKTLALTLDGWQSFGPPEAIFHAHLEFLRAHGMHGGVATTATGGIPPAWLEGYLLHLQTVLDGGKALVLMPRQACDQLSTAAFPVYKGGKSDPSPPAKPEGIILAVYGSIDKYPFLQKTRWDILYFVNPDATFKTNRSAAFTTIRGIAARLRLGQFALPYAAMPNQRQQAVAELLRLPQGIRAHCIRDIGTRLSLPAPYAMHPKKLTPADFAPALELPGRAPQGETIPHRRAPNIVMLGGMRFAIQAGKPAGETRFMEELKRHAHSTAHRANYVPFVAYYPTYAAMSRGQQQWYFYWRAQARMGRYLPTDLPYILLHVYELLAGVGFQQPAEGYRSLAGLWHAYRDTHPKVDAFLPEWILDFIVLAKLDRELAAFLGDNASILSDDLLGNLGIEQRCIHQHRPPTIEIARRISRYNPQKSKFYLQGDPDAIDRQMEDILQKVDTAMRNAHGKGIFELFYPTQRIVENRRCYQNAIHQTTSTYRVEAPCFTQHPPLQAFIGSVLRYAENGMREAAGFPGRLRNIDLDTAYQDVIDVAFGKEPSAAKATGQPVRITLDLSAVEKLRSESDDLRRMLIVEDPAGEDACPPEAVAAAAAPAAMPGAMASELPDGSSADGQADPTRTEDPVHALVIRLAAHQREVLRVLSVREASQARIAEIAAAHGSMPEIIYDEINEASQAALGDLILDTLTSPPSILEEYRDALASYLSKGGA